MGFSMVVGLLVTFFVVPGSRHEGFHKIYDEFWQEGVLEGPYLLAQSKHLLRFSMRLAIYIKEKKGVKLLLKESKLVREEWTS